MRTLIVFGCFAVLGCSNSDAITADKPIVPIDSGVTQGDSPDAGGMSGGDLNISGSRLRARLYQGADGSQSFAGWHDTMRNEDCTYAISGDGSLRCLPLDKALTVSASVFSDAACSVPVVVAPTGVTCTPPKYAVSYSTASNTCQSQATIFPLTSSTPSAYHVDGTCVPYTQTGFAFYQEGPAVDPSNFVLANEVVQ